MMNKFFDSIGKAGRTCTVNYRNGMDSRRGYVAETGEDKEHFLDMLPEEKQKVLTWLRYNILPAKTVLEGHSSYGMKHVLESRTKIYMTNNQFKEAMMHCGFYPAVPDKLNWNFYIKKTSPIFQTQADGLEGLPMMGDPMDYSKLKKRDAESASEGLKVIDLD